MCAKIRLISKRFNTFAKKYDSRPIKNNPKTMKKKIFSLATIILASCAAFVSCDNDDDTTSKLPVFEKLTISPATVSPGDTLTATLTFSDSGSYIKGTYKYSTKPAAKSGEFECGSSQSSYSFWFIAPDSAATYTMTITPKTVAAYAGKNLFLDPAPMGTVSTTFTVNP